MKLFSRFALLISVFLCSFSLFGQKGHYMFIDQSGVLVIKKFQKTNIKVKKLGISDEWILFSRVKPSENDTILKYSNDGKAEIAFYDKENIQYTDGGIVKKAIRTKKTKRGSKKDIENALVMHINKSFPKTIEFNSGRINGKSWRFEKCKIALSKNGMITIRGIQSNNRYQGWTGRVFVDLLDESGNTITSVWFKSQGLDPNVTWYGKVKRNVKQYNDSQKLDFVKHPEILVGVKKIVAYGERNGSGKDIKYYTDELKKIGKDLESIGSSAQKIYALTNGAG